MIKRDIDKWYEVRDPNLLFKWSPLVSVFDENCDDAEMEFFKREQKQCERFNMKVLEACTMLAKNADFCLYYSERVVDNDEIPF